MLSHPSDKMRQKDSSTRFSCRNKGSKGKCRSPFGFDRWRDLRSGQVFDSSLAAGTRSGGPITFNLKRDKRISMGHRPMSLGPYAACDIVEFIPYQRFVGFSQSQNKKHAVAVVFHRVTSPDALLIYLS
jgi:hypothetical protein